MGIFTNPMERGLSTKQKTSLLLYLFFLIVSVWATGESISRSTELPIFACYSIGLAALLGASFCLNLIKQSRSHEYVPNRALLLIIGVIGFLFLWLVSLTSNTHNFYFVMTADKLRQQELRGVKNQLELVRDKSVTSFELAKDQFRNKIEAEISNMRAEIMNSGDMGHGKATDSIIDRIGDLLQTNIQRTDPPGNDRRALNLHADEMANNIRHLVSNKLVSIDSRIGKLDEFIDQEEYGKVLGDLDLTIKEYLSKNEIEVKTTLRNSFSFYNKCFDYIKQLFENPFLKENTELEIAELPEVPESIDYENIAKSWQNFFEGKYSSLHFYLALIWALTIDIACFILFYFGVLPPEDEY